MAADENQYESQKFPCIGPGISLERNPFWGTILISSFFPRFAGFRIGFDGISSLGRPAGKISSRDPRPGRPRVSKFTKPIRKPAILGFGELILLVPFFQEIGAFKMFLMKLVHLGAVLCKKGFGPIRKPVIFRSKRN